LSFTGFCMIYFNKKSAAALVTEVSGARNYLIAWSVFDCGISLLSFETAVVEYVE